MKMELRGDLDAIEPILKEFVNLAKEEYNRILPQQMEKVKKISLFGKTPELPDEIMMEYFRHEDHILLIDTMPIPKFVAKLFSRKMEKNLREFIKSKGVNDVKVKFLLK